MAAILIEMSCLNKRGKECVMDRQGWEDLQSEFKVNSMEVTQSHLDGKDYWYIRLGEMEECSQSSRKCLHRP
jgi:hypothetical protein